MIHKMQLQTVKMFIDFLNNLADFTVQKYKILSPL